MKRVHPLLAVALAGLTVLSSAGPAWAGLKVKLPRISVQAPKISVGPGRVHVRLPAVRVTPPSVKIQPGRRPEQPEIMFVPGHSRSPGR